MNLFESVDLARKHTGHKLSLTESARQAPTAPDKTRLALGVLRHLHETKAPETAPVQMPAMPVPN